jgi:hypothetical protein
MALPSASDIGSLFDHYGRQARLFPALLTVFPPLLAVLAWFPWLLVSSLGATLLTLATSCGLLYALSSWARTKGKRVETRLLKKWGGWPTTILLRHSSSLDALTRSRYHGFLAAHVPGMVMPTAADQQNAPAAADAAYASSVMWLKERVRGKDFPMVDRENAQYGFRRNLRGLKWIGIFGCLLTAVVSLAAIAYQTPELENLVASRRWGELANQLGTFGPSVWLATAVNVIGIVAWLLIVTYRWVWEGGLQYATALLATCDRLQQQAAGSTVAPRRRQAP